jgi:hypothetical protein
VDWADCSNVTSFLDVERSRRGKKRRKKKEGRKKERRERKEKEGGEELEEARGREDRGEKKEEKSNPPADKSPTGLRPKFSPKSQSLHFCFYLINNKNK